MMKPIFVIQLKSSPELVHNVYRSIDQHPISRDYHVLVFAGEETKFQVFSDKEIEPIQIEELKAMFIGDLAGTK